MVIMSVHYKSECHSQSASILFDPRLWDVDPGIHQSILKKWTYSGATWLQNFER